MVRKIYQHTLKCAVFSTVKSHRIVMEAERQNQLAARLEDYAEREQALRGYL